jgi:membrane protease YdiL (CAAX protease family)
VTPFAYLHLLFFGAFIPYASWRTKKRVAGGAPRFRTHVQATLINLTLFGVFSIIVARIEWIRLFPARVPSLESMGAGVIVLALMIVYMRPRWRRAVEKRADILRMFIPRNSTERTQWIAVATLAGISEEITWRGVQFALLQRLLHNPLLAAAICALSFALGHIVQGWRSAIVVFVFAGGFQLLAWLAGSLYVAMTVHLAYDIVAGLSYSRLARELNYDDIVVTPQ